MLAVAAPAANAYVSSGDIVRRRAPVPRDHEGGYSDVSRRSLAHSRRVTVRRKIALEPAGGAVQRTSVSLTLT